MKSLEYLRVFQLQWDMHKVKVIKSYTGLFNECVERSPILCRNPTSYIYNEHFKAPFA